MPQLAWPGADQDLLYRTIEALADAQSESLVITLHDHLGAFVGTLEFRGSQDIVTLRYRDLIERVLARRASGLLLIHNHPSGDPAPSRSDVASTLSLAALCKSLDIVLHDHLVVGRTSVISMRRAGLLDRQAPR